MTIVNSAAADGFIERLPKEVRFYLVHGPTRAWRTSGSKAIVRQSASAAIRTRCGSCASRATRSRAIPARLPTKPMQSRCSGAPGRSGSTRRDAISCRRSSLCSRGRRPIARSSSRPGSSRRDRLKRRLRKARRPASSIECYSDDADALDALDRRGGPRGRAFDRAGRARRRSSRSSAPTARRREAKSPS